MRFFLSVLSCALLSVVVVLGLMPSSAHAHSGKQSYLYISVFDDAVEGRVEIPAADLGPALGTEIPQDVGAARSMLGDLTAPVNRYVADNLALSGESGPWTLDFAAAPTILPTENGPYVVLPFVVDEDFSEAPSSFTADLSVIIESDPEKDALLIIEDDWATATFENESEPIAGFSVGRTEQTVELGGASTIDAMIAIRGLGTDAVRTGIDLMLIVVAVVLPALMVPATRRTHVTTPTETLRRLATGLLALVAGHSVTLWLVGTGVLGPSARLTAMLVAASLCAMAIFGLVAWWRPALWAVAVPVIVVVGLLQGLGLGAAFEARDLDRRRPLTSLLAFHIGVEVALVVLVVLVAVPLALLRRTRVASWVTVGFGVILLGYGLAWLGERGAETNWPIEEFANPLRVWPRNVWFVVLAIVVAAAIRHWDARSGHLRPVDDERSDAGADGLRQDREVILT